MSTVPQQLTPEVIAALLAASPSRRRSTCTLRPIMASPPTRPTRPYIWTPPHFWALALVKAGEYARAGIPMMPNTAGPDCLVGRLALAPAQHLHAEADHGQPADEADETVEQAAEAEEDLRPPGGAGPRAVPAGSRLKRPPLRSTR
jgi:hypothetical protein